MSENDGSKSFWSTFSNSLKNSKYVIVLVTLLIFLVLIEIGGLFNKARYQQDSATYHDSSSSGVRFASDNSQPNPDFVKASGKCAQCHALETPAVIEQFSHSRHQQVGVSCIDCHRPVANQDKVNHKGFQISKDITSQNCAQCHGTQYEQFIRSRHGAPAWAAVVGREGFTPEQIAFAEKYHKGAVDRNPNALAKVEGGGTTVKGCMVCHQIGRPNSDGSIGNCTECHSYHRASVKLARQPETCGQCHLGPDHSQIEIFNSSKHGALFNAFKGTMNLDQRPNQLTTKDMPVPSCATCHMSGINGQRFTHDTTERLSYFLFAAISEQRPNFEAAQIQMKETCSKCHTSGHVDKFYKDSEQLVFEVNDKIQIALDMIAEAKKEGLFNDKPFDEKIDFLAFDIWHYYGRTAKHGAFMGGADYVQWHGTYEIHQKTIELEELINDLREKKAKGTLKTGSSIKY